MKHTAKRLLSIALVLVLACSLMVSAIATGTDDAEPETEAETEETEIFEEEEPAAEVEADAEGETDAEEIDSEDEVEPADETEVETVEFEEETETASEPDAPDAEETDEDYDIALLDETSDSEESENIEWITLTDGGELTSGYYRLESDVTMTVDITIPYYTEVTIDLNGHALKGTGTASAITNNGTFTLEDSSGNDSGTLTGPTNQEYSVKGGGVYNKSIFTMNGGTICDNMVKGYLYGGGVYNDYYSTFTMNGGSISNNAGSGVYLISSIFTMNGGSISSNKSDFNGGGGVYNYNYSEFIMNGGSIDNNIASQGGGVYNNGHSTFTMNGGSISDNDGSGVYMTSGCDCTMNGGSINGNTANYGGGVYNYNGTFTMHGGSIDKNTANTSGGGVRVEGGTFTMTGGSITENTAGDTNLGYKGNNGGVYKSDSSYMYISGDAKISGNQAVKYFEVYGDYGFSSSYYDFVTDNVYLDLSATEDYPTRSYIQLTGPLTEGACIGVTTSIEPTTDNPLQITSAERDTVYYAESAQYFFSDEGYTVQANDDGKYVELCYTDQSSSDTEKPHTHTPVDDPTVEPTCTEPGLTAGSHCSVCGEILTAQTEIPALGHDYVGTETLEPTCTKTGETTYTCSRCGDSYTEPIAPLGHNYVGAVTLEPTCTEAGQTTYTCSRCGDSYTEPVAALGHNYVGEVTTPATYEEDGKITYTCTRCGDSYTADISKLTYGLDVKGSSGIEVSVEVMGDPDARYVLDIEDINDSVSDAETVLVESAVESAFSDMDADYYYLDISIEKYINSELTEHAESTDWPISLTVGVPNAISGADDYVVVRVHEKNGENVVTILDTVYDAESGTVTFETDEFSTYAIVALSSMDNEAALTEDEETDAGLPGSDDADGKDSTENAEDGKDSAETEAAENDTAAENTSAAGGASPKTSDNAPIYAVMILMLCAAGVCVFLIAKRKRA